MARKIDVEKVRAAVDLFGFETPFYEFHAVLPKSNLNELVKAGFLQRGGNKKKGYIWTERVSELLGEAESREKRVASMRSALQEIAEPKRGFPFGTRRVASLPDSDGNPTDHDDIDQS
jgi:hypothetical protein